MAKVEQVIVDKYVPIIRKHYMKEIIMTVLCFVVFIAALFVPCFRQDSGLAAFVEKYDLPHIGASKKVFSVFEEHAEQYEKELDKVREESEELADLLLLDIFSETLHPDFWTEVYETMNFREGQKLDLEQRTELIACYKRWTTWYSIMDWEYQDVGEGMEKVWNIKYWVFISVGVGCLFLVLQLCIFAGKSIEEECEILIDGIYTGDSFNTIKWLKGSYIDATAIGGTKTSCVACLVSYSVFIISRLSQVSKLEFSSLFVVPSLFFLALWVAYTLLVGHMETVYPNVINDIGKECNERYGKLKRSGEGKAVTATVTNVPVAEKVAESTTVAQTVHIEENKKEGERKNMEGKVLIRIMDVSRKDLAVAIKEVMAIARLPLAFAKKIVEGNGVIKEGLTLEEALEIEERFSALHLTTSIEEM